MAEMIDLDADRERRASQRETGDDGLPIKMGGKVVATLPPEFPLDVLEPLRTIDQDITLVIRQAFQMQQGNDPMAAASLLVDLLASNPNLPSQLLDVLNESATRLLGADGMAALKDFKPSGPDIAALARGVSRYYGFSLGESSESSDSQETGGETSKRTSRSTTKSTSAASTRRRAKKAS